MNQISVKTLLLVIALGFFPRLSSASPIKVTNGQNALNETQHIVLEEVWTVGDDDRGNIYLLDTQLSDVKVLSPAGVLRRTLGREGDGPLSGPESGGEFQMEGLRVGGETVIVSGTIQAVDQEKGVLTRDDFLAHLDLHTGMVGRKIVERSSYLDFAKIRLDEKDLAGGPTGRYGGLPDGRLVVAIPRNEYEVSIFSPDGFLERVFSRKFVS